MTIKASSVRINERRQFGRRSAVWHAWVERDGAQRLACVVRNVSAQGALLELAAPTWLPPYFDLVLELDQIRLTCEVRHKGIHGVGVMFKDPAAGGQLLALFRSRPYSRP